MANLVRGEIEEEVNRINREMADDDWKPTGNRGDRSNVSGEGDGI